MAQVIKLKSSSVDLSIPLVGDLIAGELAINTYNGLLFIKKNDGAESIVTIGADAQTLNGESASYYLDYDNFSNTPTIDATPTDGSTNAVQSDGVFDALAGKQADLGFTPEDSANKGAADGYASLGVDSKIPSGQLPAIAITDSFAVADEAEMLALTAETGDVAVRADENKTYILQGTDPSVLEDWLEMTTPTDVVLSVNGETGAITLTTTDITEGTNEYYTDAKVLTAVGGSLNDSGSGSTDLWSATKIDTFVLSAVEAGSAVEAVIDPIGSDDVDDGYYIGQVWVNTDSDAIFILVDGTTDSAIWTELGSGGGDISGAANVGTAGVGVFKNETTGTLNFKKLNNTSDNNITITDDTGDDEIDISINFNDSGTGAEDALSAEKILTRTIDGGSY